MFSAQTKYEIEQVKNKEWFTFSEIVKAWQLEANDSKEAIVHVMHNLRMHAPRLISTGMEDLMGEIPSHLDPVQADNVDGKLFVFSSIPANTEAQSKESQDYILDEMDSLRADNDSLDNIEQALFRCENHKAADIIDIVRSVIIERDNYYDEIFTFYERDTTDYSSIIFGQKQHDGGLGAYKKSFTNLSAPIDQHYRLHGLPEISLFDYFLFTPEIDEFLCIKKEYLDDLFSRSNQPYPSVFGGTKNYYIDFDKTNDLIGLAQKCHVELCDENNNILKIEYITEEEEKIKKKAPKGMAELYIRATRILKWANEKHLTYEKKINKETIKIVAVDFQAAVSIASVVVEAEWASYKGKKLKRKPKS